MTKTLIDEILEEFENKFKGYLYNGANGTNKETFIVFLRQSLSRVEVVTKQKVINTILVNLYRSNVAREVESIVSMAIEDYLTQLATPQATEKVSFFDLLLSEKRKIIQKAIDDNKARAELVKSVKDIDVPKKDCQWCHDPSCLCNKNCNCESTQEYLNRICKHCNKPIRFGANDPFCDHLYYPENCEICQTE